MDDLKQKFIMACRDSIDNIKTEQKNRRVLIGGAGHGGELAQKILEENGITVAGYVDKNAAISRFYKNLPVLSWEDISPETDYIFISLMTFDMELIKKLYEKGFRWMDYSYPLTETVNKEDIVFRGIWIGRYTYGYEALLSDCPLAESIGRYCSINSTARIWNNHSLDCVTTHPILDHPMFFEKKKFEQRQEFLTKYGKHWNNAVFENSPIRNNRPVIVKNDVWIGANAVILPGVTIGNGAVVAAGAVVTQSIPSYAIVGGVPAKILKYRFSKEQIRLFEQIAWWDWEHAAIEENIEFFYQPSCFLNKFGGENANR